VLLNQLKSHTLRFRPKSGGAVGYNAHEGGYFIVDAPAALRHIEGNPPNGAGCEMSLLDLVLGREQAFIDLGDLVCAGAGDQMKPAIRVRPE